MRRTLLAFWVFLLAATSSCQPPSWFVPAGKMKKKAPPSGPGSSDHPFGSIFEMIMGAGKTSVLLPLIAEQTAKSGERLSVVVLPASLLPSMARQVSDQLSRVFGKAIDVIEINRQQKFSNVEILDLKERLQNALMHERILVMSNSSVQSLFLRLLEKMVSEKTPPQDIQDLLDIIMLFRNKAQLLIDEVDIILDVMKAHRFAMGQAMLVERDVLEATAGLFRLLITDNEIKNEVHFDFLADSTGQPFRFDYYQEKVKGKLIAKLTDKAKVEAIFPSKLVSRYHQALKGMKAGPLAEFLASQDPEAIKNFLASLANDVQRNIAAVWFTQLNNVLPLTLSKANKVHFGTFPELPQCKTQHCPDMIAIPYVAGTPLTTSRFASELEVINYSIQSHLEEGQAQRLLPKELKRLKEAYTKAQAGVGQEAILAQGNAIFYDLLPGMFLRKNTVTGKYIDYLNKNPELYLQILLPNLEQQLQVYESELHTNSLIYLSMFAGIQGISGTLWNRDTFPKFYDRQHISDTQAKTLALIHTHSAEAVKVVDMPDRTPTATKVSLLFSDSAETSLIDQGGFFRGIPNKDVVAALSAMKADSCENYLFYDHRGFLQMMQDGHTVAPYDPHGLDRKVTCGYWDQSHTTGADYKVAENNLALLTVSKHSILRDLLQAVWRLRGLDKGQRVNFAISMADMQYMDRLMTNEVANPIPSKKRSGLLSFLMTNEASLLSKQNFRAISYRFKNELITAFFKALQEKPQNYAEIMRDFRFLFEEKRVTPIYKRYGRVQVKLQSREAIQKLRDRLLERANVKNLIEKNYLGEKWLRNRLNAIIDEGLPLIKPWVEVDLGREDYAEQAMEVELEMELEMEQENEHENETEFEAVDLNSEQTLKDRIHWYDRSLLFSGQYLDQPAQLANLRRPYADVASVPAVSTLSNLLEADGWSGAAKMFGDARILASLNVAPAFQLEGENKQPRFAFFSPYQKEFNEVLVATNSIDDIVSLTLIDRDDAYELGEQLNENYWGSYAPGKYRYLIYQLNGDFIRISAPRRDDRDIDILLQKLRSQEIFAVWMPRLKWLSGRTHYTSLETDSLRPWFFSHGVEEIYTLFVDHILKYRADSNAHFHNSDLSRLFDILRNGGAKK